MARLANALEPTRSRRLDVSGALRHRGRPPVYLERLTPDEEEETGGGGELLWPALCTLAAVLFWLL